MTEAGSRAGWSGPVPAGGRERLVLAGFGRSLRGCSVQGRYPRRRAGGNDDHDVLLVLHCRSTVSHWIRSCQHRRSTVMTGGVIRRREKMLTRDPPPARRTTRSRGTGGDGKITRDLVLAAALEITGLDGAGAHPWCMTPRLAAAPSGSSIPVTATHTRPPPWSLDEMARADLAARPPRPRGTNKASPPPGASSMAKNRPTGMCGSPARGKRDKTGADRQSERLYAPVLVHS